MNKDLEGLIALQKLDTAVHDARHRLAEEPERAKALDARFAAAKRAEKALADEQKAVEADRKALQNETTELNVSLERMGREREALAKALDPAALATFDLVAKKRNGVAVAEARDAICTICHVRMRPQVFNNVRRDD